MSAQTPEQCDELFGRYAPFTMRHKATEIVRRQADGTWRFAIDDPYARG